MGKGSEGLPGQDRASGGATPKSAATEGSVAEWAVVRATWRQFAAVGPISKQTAQRIYHPDLYRGQRDTFTDLNLVLYRGDEATARRLVEQLISSAALGEQERRVSPTYYAEDWQREDGPEECASADIGEWS